MAEQPDSYALTLADESYGWYRTAAARSRRNHRLSAIVQVAMAAAIPVSAAIAPRNAVVPAVLGALLVILAGLRSTYNWQENYIRFSVAREAVEAQRRLFHTGAAPYDDPQTRGAALAAQITAIERDEQSAWVSVVTEPRSKA
jgi:hypothetical protein